MSRLTRSSLAVWVIAASLLLACSSWSLARQPKKYQVTGTVLEVTDDFIAVDKTGERWEIGRDANTKVTGTLKVGGKVTVEYQMSASRIESRDAARGGSRGSPNSPANSGK